MLTRLFKRLYKPLTILVVLGLLVGCVPMEVSQNSSPVVETHPEPVVPESSSSTSPVSVDQNFPTGTSTPRPDFLPEDSELIITPVPAPAAPGSEIYRSYSGPSYEEIVYRQQTQGYVECPEEQVYLTEEGIAFVCPGEGADMSMMAAVFVPAGGIALLDGPEPGPADIGSVLYIFVSGALVLTTGYALSQMPRVLMARNPNLLPDVVVPPSIPAPPPHLQNHDRGPYTSKLKMLGWVAVMTSWLATETGGPKPDWCGQREDGAILIFFAAQQIVTTTGRVYQGIAAIVNTGGAHLSTILTGVKPPATPGGLPDPGNSGGNDFSQFTPIDPGNCPPMPRVVTQ